MRVMTHVNDRLTDALSLRKKLQSGQKQVLEVSLVRKGTLSRACVACAYQQREAGSRACCHCPQR